MERIKIDYSKQELPGSVKNFLPDVYRDGDLYYCILGADTQSAIIGAGKNIDEAMANWDKVYCRKKSKNAGRDLSFNL